MAPEKEKPVVETVQQTMKLSDLLMVEVCQPIKESTDKIPLCFPALPGGGKPKLCEPLISCGQLICRPSIYCIPYWVCIPRRVTVCVPKLTGDCLPIVCKPIQEPLVPVESEFPGPSPEDYLNVLQAELAQKLTVNELTRLREEVAVLKEEVAVMKGKVHGK